jgi:hypothetical protein
MRVFERAQLVGTLAMIVTSRWYWWDKRTPEIKIFDPDEIREPENGSFYSALFHDITMILLIVGIFVEGFRLIQIPMISTFIICQLMYGDQVTNNLEIIETATAIHVICYLLYGEPGYKSFQTTGPF